MKFESSFSFSIWISILSTGLLQIYVIYSSLSRYIILKSEFFDKYINEYNWVIYLLNFQLFVIIGALGALPLWFYSIIFSVSSFFYSHPSPKINRNGFYEVIWNEAVNFLKHQKNNSNVQNPKICKGKIKIGVFYPVASIFNIFIAYSLLLPVPFIEAWLIHIDHVNKETLSNNELDFLFSNSLTTKIKWSIEYLNFVISLIVFSLQYPNLLWVTNKLFSMVFSLLEFLIVIHILLDFPMISSVIKTYCKNCKQRTNTTLIYSGVLMLSSVISNILLLITFFAIFQFACEKCIQTVLKSSWFNNNNRVELSMSVNNIDQYPSQSNTSYSVLCSSDKIRIKTSFNPFICAALFFIFGIVIKGVVYYQFQEFRRDSKLFIIYLIQSLALVIFYFMFWFGIALKPNWTFDLKEIERKFISMQSSEQKEENNYYKFSKTNLKSSQTSLSSVSNTVLSLHSMPPQSSYNRLDFTNPDPYANKCHSLKVTSQNKDNQDNGDYILLSQHLPQARIYKTMYSSITSPKPIIEDRRDKLSVGSFYKCGSYFTVKKPNDNIRYEEPYQMNRKSNMEFSIQEETSNDNISSISDEVSSNMTSSPNKNNSNMKFVTFRLDNNAEIAAEISTTNSNESLTIISLEQSEAFLKELDGEGSDKMHFNIFKKDISSEFRDKFILTNDPMSGDSHSYPMTINQSKTSLL